MDTTQAMHRALELATNGTLKDVNPQVGCVILSSDGKILSEGWHRGAGTPHAEIDALSKLGVDAARGSTAVVTLEPCNHTGRTGPCTEALIDAGVTHVVYAVADPSTHGGTTQLREAGIDVTAGVLAQEVEQFIMEWLTVTRLGRLIVTVKWASSIDGRAAAHDGSSRWITGSEARADVHRRRAASDAIIVGSGTVRADNPALTARHPDGTLMDLQPVPVVIGHTKIPEDALIWSHPQKLLTYSGDNLEGILVDLHNRGFRTALVEGGPTLASAFIRASLADEYLVYFAPTVVGGSGLALGDLGVTTINEAIRLTITALHRLGEDILVTLQPMKGR
jgi:diaminohydroxyphosphoribosylaminopyrimidine deaminase/5-amino-6-(5-phosphoribosylamino)uracil reductase